MKCGQDGGYKQNSKTWSEEAIDTLTNCFQSHERIWNATSVIKTKTESLYLSKNLICQCENITSTDMTIKKWNNLRGQFLLFS